jgi:hypothetical protein
MSSNYLIRSTKEIVRIMKQGDWGVGVLKAM